MRAFFSLGAVRLGRFTYGGSYCGWCVDLGTALMGMPSVKSKSLRVAKFAPAGKFGLGGTNLGANFKFSGVQSFLLLTKVCIKVYTEVCPS